MTDVFLLEHDYRTGKVSKPVDPEGNIYEDPNVDLHLVAASFKYKEIESNLTKAPWLVTKERYKKERFEGKTLNFG